MFPPIYIIYEKNKGHILENIKVSSLSSSITFMFKTTYGSIKSEGRSGFSLIENIFITKDSIYFRIKDFKKETMLFSLIKIKSKREVEIPLNYLYISLMVSHITSNVLPQNQETYGLEFTNNKENASYSIFSSKKEIIDEIANEFQIRGIPIKGYASSDFNNFKVI